jgi:hypothetical protein
MLVKAIHVKNYRSLLDAHLPCEALTVLVGPNGAGKSAFLRALELFYVDPPMLADEDFYNRDSSKPIEIALTFTDLDEEEREQFSSYVEGSDLTVVRVLTLVGTKTVAKYHGSSRQFPAFLSVRSAASAADKKRAYEQIRQDPGFAHLPRWSKQDVALADLSNWEAQHPDQCRRERDDGQFFGFAQVGRGYLGRHTRFILVPAVRDAGDDAQESRGSAITELMDLVVRSVLANRDDVVRFREETKKRYDDLLDPTRLAELSSLESKLTCTLRDFAPDASVAMDWLKADEIDVPLPKARVGLVEDGFRASVSRTGHGLQRAFVITLLQHLAIAVAGTDQIGQVPDAQPDNQPGSRTELPNLILAIEECEIYQHPSRQRHLARLLDRIASGSVPGVAKRTQVICCTHSPLFVGLDHFDRIRKLSKSPRGAGEPKATKVISSALSDIARRLWEVTDVSKPMFTAETLRPRLQAIMTPWMNEGFFADAVVLVEGEDDRAALLGVAAAKGHDLDAKGIAIIPCGGKSNIDRPFLIFTSFGIPTYAVWDGDQAKKAGEETNRRLLRLVGVQEEAWPTAVTAKYACFKDKLEETLREELGPDCYAGFMERAREAIGIPASQPVKTPAVFNELIRVAGRDGRSSPTLEGIIANVIALLPAAAT